MTEPHSTTEPSFKLAVYGIIEALRLGLLPARMGAQAMLRVRRAMKGELELRNKSEDEVLAILADEIVKMHNGERRDPVKQKEQQRRLHFFMTHGVWPTKEKVR